MQPWLWDTVRDMALAFLATDTDLGGSLSTNELKKIARSGMLGIEEDELESRILKYDKDRTGDLDFSEFMDFYASLSSVRYLEEHVFRVWGGGTPLRLRRPPPPRHRHRPEWRSSAPHPEDVLLKVADRRQRRVEVHEFAEVEVA
eukprot:gene12165-23779_t